MSLEILELLGFKSIVRCCSGMWEHLTARVNARTAVQLEQERNRGTVNAIEALGVLGAGAELFEDEPSGRRRIIRTPYPTVSPPIVLGDDTERPAPGTELAQ